MIDLISREVSTWLVGVLYYIIHYCWRLVSNSTCLIGNRRKAFGQLLMAKFDEGQASLGHFHRGVVIAWLYDGQASNSYIWQPDSMTARLLSVSLDSLI